jgi:hypothetical protein
MRFKLRGEKRAINSKMEYVMKVQKDVGLNGYLTLHIQPPPSIHLGHLF